MYIYIYIYIYICITCHLPSTRCRSPLAETRSFAAVDTSGDVNTWLE